jgi:hypothetical protein
MKLVAYFSATGTTEKLAERVASVLKADIFEIKPKEPYTRDDLNWNNQNSRSSKEMNNRSFRPEIKEKLANIEDYDTIYVGFPIWWYIAPTIINTFLESYDLTGKTIIPFATSGGSGMGNTNKELKDSCKGAILKEGKRLRVTASDEEIEELGKN